MKKAHKDQIRLFILNRLRLDQNRVREDLDWFAEAYDLHPFDVAEFFENEVDRINKLFNYPAQ